MTFLILGIVFLISGFFFFYKANQIEINRSRQQEQYWQQLRNEITALQQKKNKLIYLENQKKKEIQEELSQFKKDKQRELEEDLQKEKKLAQLSIEKANAEVSSEIQAIHQDLNNIRESAAQEKQEIQNDINKIKASLSAGVEARLREQQKKDKINFYKLSINDADLADVKMLENLKASFHKPVVLSKLIWTQYFQKQMTELCDRVLGKKTICGIYKITNLNSEQCYIGQSVDVSKRWKDHCKCGLGIEASATNKLYNNMQKNGVWNFSFELLEECPRELLNQKEAFWIDTYSSNIYGLNTMKGIKA